MSPLGLSNEQINFNTNSYYNNSNNNNNNINNSHSALTRLRTSSC